MPYTKTDDSLGRPLIDRPRLLPADLRYDLPAETFERIKDAIIALEARTAALETAPAASGLAVGALLWEWNRQDTSQFEAVAHTFNRDIGGATENADTELSLSVVDMGGRIGNALRLTASASFRGGGVIAVLENELALPDRYVARVVYGGVTGTGKAGFLPCYNPDVGGNCQGLFIYRTSSAVNVNAIRNNNPSVNASLGDGGPLDAPALAQGGGVGLFTTFRQRTADNPANWLVQSLCYTYDADPPEYDGLLPSGLSVGTDWDGLDFGRFGLGTWQGLLTGSAGTADFYDLKIYAHPED